MLARLSPHREILPCITSWLRGVIIVAEENRNFEFEDQDTPDTRRSSGRDSLRRRSIANARSRGRKRGTPVKFNGIHRRRSRRQSW